LDHVENSSCVPLNDHYQQRPLFAESYLVTDLRATV
jgi:hypothetical protein